MEQGGIAGVWTLLSNLFSPVGCSPVGAGGEWESLCHDTAEQPAVLAPLRSQ